MSLLSLKTDALLLLMKYLDPVDHFRLVLSGALGGTNFTEEKCRDLEEISVVIEFGTYSGRLPIGVKSLIFNSKPSPSAALLEEFVNEEIMRSIRRLDIVTHPFKFGLYEGTICSLEHLEALHLGDGTVTIRELHRVASCQKITRLRIGSLSVSDFEITEKEEVKDRLVRFLGKLAHLEVIQVPIKENIEISFLLQMLNWCQNMSTLHLYQLPDTDVLASEYPNFDLRNKLGTLHLWYLSTEWDKPALYPTINDLYAPVIHIRTPIASSEWRDVVKHLCYGKQQQSLITISSSITQNLPLYTNITRLSSLGKCKAYDVYQVKRFTRKVQQLDFSWKENPDVLSVLAALEGCHQLRRVTLEREHHYNHAMVHTPADSLYNALSKLKNLNYLHLRDKFYFGSLQAAHDYLETKKSQLITPLRPSFTVISVCDDCRQVVTLS